MCLLFQPLVDFRDRAGRAHGERAPRLAWWESIVGEVQAAKRVAARVVDSLARRWAWLDQQAGPTLALLLAAAGGDLDVLAELARRGKSRVKREQWLLLGPNLRPSWVAVPTLAT